MANDVTITIGAKDNASDVFKRVNAALKKTGHAAKGATGGTKGLDASLKGLAINAAKMAGGLFAAQKAIGAVTAFMSDSIRVGAKFGAAMSRVGALAGGLEKSSSQFIKLQNEARRLGSQTAFTATQAAEGMQMLAMAGFNATQVVDAMEGVLTVTAAAGSDMATTADIMTNVLSGFGLQARESARVADVLTKTFTSSNTTIEGLGLSMSFVATQAESMGVELEDVAAAIGKLGNVGIKGMRAGTVLRSALSRLAAPTKEAAMEMKMLGIEVVNTATGQMKSFPQIIGEFERAMVGMTDVERAQSLQMIVSQEGIAGFGALLKVGQKDLQAYGDELRNSAGTAADIAAKQLDNLQGSMTELNSRIEGFKLAVFDSMEGPIKSLIDNALIPAVTWLTAFHKGLSAIESLNIEEATSILKGEEGADFSTFQTMFNYLIYGAQGAAITQEQRVRAMAEAIKREQQARGSYPGEKEEGYYASRQGELDEQANKKRIANERKLRQELEKLGVQEEKRIANAEWLTEKLYQGGHFKAYAKSLKLTEDQAQSLVREGLMPIGEAMENVAKDRRKMLEADESISAYQIALKDLDNVIIDTEIDLQLFLADMEPKPKITGTWQILASDIKRFFTGSGGVFPAISKGIEAYKNSLSTMADTISTEVTSAMTGFQSTLSSGFRDLFFGSELTEGADEARKKIKDVRAIAEGLQLDILELGGSQAEAQRAQLEDLFGQALANPLTDKNRQNIENLRQRMYSLMVLPGADTLSAFQSGIESTIDQLKASTGLVGRFREFGASLREGLLESFQVGFSDILANLVMKGLLALGESVLSGGIYNKLKEVGGWMVENLGRPILTGMQTVWNGIQKVVEAPFEVVARFVRAGSGVIYNIAIGALKVVKRKFEVVGNFIRSGSGVIYNIAIGAKAVIDRGFEVTSNFIRSGSGVIYNIAIGALRITKKSFEVIGSFLRGGSGVIYNIAIGAVQLVKKSFEVIGKFIRDGSGVIYNIAIGAIKITQKSFEVIGKFIRSGSGVIYNIAIGTFRITKKSFDVIGNFLRDGSGVIYNIAIGAIKITQKSFEVIGNFIRDGSGVIYNIAIGTIQLVKKSFEVVGNFIRSGSGIIYNIAISAFRITEKSFEIIGDFIHGGSEVIYNIAIGTIQLVKKSFEVVGNFIRSGSGIIYNIAIGTFRITEKTFQVAGNFIRDGSGVIYNIAIGAIRLVKKSFDIAANFIKGVNWTNSVWNLFMGIGGVLKRGIEIVANKTGDFWSWLTGNEEKSVGINPFASKSALDKYTADLQGALAAAFVGEDKGGWLSNLASSLSATFKGIFKSTSGEAIEKGIGDAFQAGIAGAGIAEMFGKDGLVGAGIATALQATLKALSGKDWTGAIISGIAAAITLYKGIFGTEGKAEQRGAAIAGIQQAIREGDIRKFQLTSALEGATGKTFGEDVGSTLITIQTIARTFSLTEDKAVELINDLRNIRYISQETASTWNDILGATQSATLYQELMKTAISEGSKELSDFIDAYKKFYRGEPWNLPTSEAGWSVLRTQLRDRGELEAIMNPPSSPGPQPEEPAQTEKFGKIDLFTIGRGSGAWAQKYHAMITAGNNAGVAQDIKDAVAEVNRLRPAGQKYDVRDNATAWSMYMAGGGGITVPYFQHGGLVPGSRSTPVPAILHGQERILTASQADQMDRGGVTLNLHVYGNGDDGIMRLIKEQALPWIQSSIERGLSRKGRFRQWELDSQTIRTVLQ